MKYSIPIKNKSLAALNNVKNQVNDQDMFMITYVNEMGSKNYALIQNNEKNK